jgi:hypothetical protein
LKIPPSIFGTVTETKNGRRTTYFQPPEKYENYLPTGEIGNFSAIGSSDWIAKSGRTRSFTRRATGLIARPDKSTGLPREWHPKSPASQSHFAGILCPRQLVRYGTPDDQEAAGQTFREFQAKYIVGSAPRIRVRLNAKLVGLPQREILATETFEFLEPATSPNLEAVVSTFDIVLEKTFKRIVNWSPTSVP